MVTLLSDYSLTMINKNSIMKTITTIITLLVSVIGLSFAVNYCLSYIMLFGRNYDGSSSSPTVEDTAHVIPPIVLLLSCLLQLGLVFYLSQRGTELQTSSVFWTIVCNVFVIGMIIGTVWYVDSYWSNPFNF